MVGLFSEVATPKAAAKERTEEAEPKGLRICTKERSPVGSDALVSNSKHCSY